MTDPTETKTPPARGRPRTRFADKKEQVRQNMQLYRARRTAELEALARTLESMLVALEQGDAAKSFTTAAAVAGIWKESVLRVNLLGRGQAAAAKRNAASDRVLE